MRNENPALLALAGFILWSLEVRVRTPHLTIRGLKVLFGSEELAQTKDLGDSVRIPTYKEEFSSRNKLFFGWADPSQYGTKSR